VAAPLQPVVAPGETAADIPAPPAAPVEELPPDPAEIVPRLQSAVARVLPAIEATLARLAAGPMHPREMERAARTLTSLTRTLRELNGLLSEYQARGVTQDDTPEDIDAFRIALARRIDALVASQQDAENGATTKTEGE
jgi:phytoene dehydrogenase-like protein